MNAGSSLGVLDGRPHTELYVLAALCAQHAAWLDSDTLDRVRRGIRSVVEPRNNLELHLLARLGPYVLPLLPSPAPRPMSHETLVVDLINEIGGADAIPYARRFAEKADGSSHFASSLAGNWANYPAGEYAKSSLAST
ncbi:hypothetical protein ACQEVG_21945 [Streptomyces sp. CA-135486]|uniref:hypothetical protein n=1 Tax=Streptomyces sp. CA-135486 TaxID=3240049 RepID=UPI003D90E55F